MIAQMLNQVLAPMLANGTVLDAVVAGSSANSNATLRRRLTMRDQPARRLPGLGARHAK